jgi:hypothetical protein
MEKQKYRIEFWKNGRKIISKVSNELAREGSRLTKDFYITRTSDWKYIVKEVKEVENTVQNTHVLNHDENNPEVLPDKSYVVELE